MVHFARSSTLSPQMQHTCTTKSVNPLNMHLLRKRSVLRSLSARLIGYGSATSHHLHRALQLKSTRWFGLNLTPRSREF
jgi:hypothetical protein